MNFFPRVKKAEVEEPAADPVKHRLILAELNAFPMKLPDPPAESPVATVQFAKTGVTLPWEDRFESLLEFADNHGIEISSGCKYGDCGTCMTALLGGTVSYNHVTGITPDAGFCLPCSCQPSSSIIMDI